MRNCTKKAVYCSFNADKAPVPNRVFLSLNTTAEIFQNISAKLPGVVAYLVCIICVGVYNFRQDGGGSFDEYDLERVDLTWYAVSAMSNIASIYLKLVHKDVNIKAGLSHGWVVGDLSLLNGLTLGREAFVIRE